MAESELQQVVSAPTGVTRFWVALGGVVIVGTIWATNTQNKLDQMLKAQTEVLAGISVLTGNQREIQARVDNNEMDIDVHESRLNSMGKKQ